MNFVIFITICIFSSWTEGQELWKRRSPRRRIYFSNGEFKVADEYKDPVLSDLGYQADEPPIRYWQFSEKDPQYVSNDPESEYKHSMNEFHEYYSQTHFQPQDNEIDPMGPFILAKNRKRGPPLSYRHNNKMIKIIPGHSHLGVTVVPSNYGHKIILNEPETINHGVTVLPSNYGHKIVVNSRPSGHRIVIESENNDMDHNTGYKPSDYEIHKPSQNNEKPSDYEDNLKPPNKHDNKGSPSDYENDLKPPKNHDKNKDKPLDYENHTKPPKKQDDENKNKPSDKHTKPPKQHGDKNKPSDKHTKPPKHGDKNKPSDKHTKPPKKHGDKNKDKPANHKPSDFEPTKPTKIVTETSKTTEIPDYIDCSSDDCWEKTSESIQISTPKDNPFDPVEGSAEPFPVRGSLFGEDSDQMLSDGPSKFQDSLEKRVSEDEEPPSPGRFFSLFQNMNETEPTCTTPKGEPGHCRSFRDCSLGELVGNFNLYFQYMCIIRAARVGVCCPDNPVVEVTHPDELLINETEALLESTENCGINPKTRIIGGIKSVPHEWTWMVALLRKNRFFCGGVLINNLYVLTAAHCVMSMNIRDLKIRLGEYDFNDEAKHKMDIPVAEIKRHAKFSTRTFQHDIALLRLRRSVEFNRFIGPICLPKAGNSFTGVNATVVGWGTVSFGGASSPILRQVSIPVWSNEDCDRTYTFEKIDDAFMCAGSPNEELDACQGDSGGPLMSLNEQGKWQVIGLVSWGRRCGDPNFPGVYARVTTYLDWIEENMKPKIEQ